MGANTSMPFSSSEGPLGCRVAAPGGGWERCVRWGCAAANSCGANASSTNGPGTRYS